MPTIRPASLLLVGDVDLQRDTAAPARDLYLGPVFAARRALADASGRPWFVLSSRWGLVRPDEIIAPARHSLIDQPPMYRRAWGRFVAEQLAQAVPLERGGVVEVHAEPDYVDSIRKAVEFLELAVRDAAALALVR